MMRRLGRVLITALIGCGTLAATFIVLLALAITRIVDYNFLLDLFVIFMSFMVCWGVGRLVQDQLVLRKQRNG